MKIHFVASDLKVPADDGLTGQTIELLMALQRRGISVRLSAFTKDANNVDLEQLRTMLPAINLVHLIPTRLPTAVRGYLNALGLDRLIPMGQIASLRRDLLREDGEVIHFEGLAAAGLARPALRTRAVIDLIDPPSTRQQRLSRHSSGLDRWTKRVLSILNRIYESWLASSGAVWHVVSRQDADVLRIERPQTEIWDIPVLVPVRQAAVQEGPLEKRNSSNDLNVTVVADLRQDHLRLGIKELLTELDSKKSGKAQFSIKVMGRISQATLESILPPDCQVECLEWVEDFDGALREATVVAIPDRVGTGLKNRTVQALSLGRPVVSFSAGVEGIPVTHGKDAYVAQNVKDFSAFVELLLQDARLRARVSGGAFRLIETWGSAERSIDRWIELYTYVDERRASL